MQTVYKGGWGQRDGDGRGKVNGDGLLDGSSMWIFHSYEFFISVNVDFQLTTLFH
jgi:hypothetical protein